MGWKYFSKNISSYEQKAVSSKESDQYFHLAGGGLTANLSLTLCDPMDCNPPSSSVHGISQTRILEWVAISFSRGCSRPRDQTCISCVAGGLLHFDGFFLLNHQGSPWSSHWIFLLPHKHNLGLVFPWWQ